MFLLVSSDFHLAQQSLFCQLLSWTFYLNTTEYTTNQPTLAGNFRVDVIGQIYSSSPRRFQGNMGPILIYNRALSATEVTQNYNALKSRFGL